MRIAFIHNPTEAVRDGGGDERVRASQVMAAALRTLSNTAAKNLVGKLLRHLSSTPGAAAGVGASLDMHSLAASDALQVHGVDAKSLLAEAQHERTRLLLRAHSRFCTHGLRLAPGERTVVSNGRVSTVYCRTDTAWFTVRTRLRVRVGARRVRRGRDVHAR